jgi:1,4-dihydroxy-6-naphthoate synthase
MPPVPSPPSITLTLAHSPDPDDVFMWWPITGKIDPRDPDRVVEPPVLDTGRFRFRAIPADIDVLNRRAIEYGDLDITALSMFAWAQVHERYALTCCGSSMGEGYGPKVVVQNDEANWRRSGVIAVPGVRTTAFLLLSLALGRETFEYVEMPFDRILEAVSSRKRVEVGARTGIELDGGTRRVSAGLLIHQSQLTFGEMGLRQILDLGAWWLEHTGLPLPLGGNALRRDLESRFGPGTLREITALLDRSIRHALKNRDESTRYAMAFAPEISREQADRYVDMYVSPLTLDAGEVGQRAIQRLLDEAAKAGMAPAMGPVELIRPS